MHPLVHSLLPLVGSFYAITASDGGHRPPSQSIRVCGCLAGGIYRFHRIGDACDVEVGACQCYDGRPRDGQEGGRLPLVPARLAHLGPDLNVYWSS